MRIGLVLTALPVLLFAACGTATRATGGGDRNVITAEEIASTRVSNAYEAVQRLRPEFLRSRGPVSIQNPDAGLPVVYVDGVRFGDLTQLRNIAATTVQSIEFVSASDATTRWGTGHAGGVLAVKTKT